MIQSIDPDQITPLHDVRSQNKLNELVCEMQESGWKGRPLLVIERASDYLAWTGSHRIAAAIEAGLSLIPCYVVQDRELTERGFDPDWGHVMDYERLKILDEIGDMEAANLMRLESANV